MPPAILSSADERSALGELHALLYSQLVALPDFEPDCSGGALARTKQAASIAMAVLSSIYGYAELSQRETRRRSFV